MTQQQWEILHARKLQVEKELNTINHIFELLNHSLSASRRQEWTIKFSKLMTEHIELERKGA